MKIISYDEVKMMGGIISSQFNKFVKDCGELVFVRPSCLVEGTKGDEIFKNLCEIKETAFYAFLEFGLDLDEALMNICSNAYIGYNYDEDEEEENE